MPEIGDPDWTEPRLFELEVPVHMQDMAENNCDPVHFHFVHGNPQHPARRRSSTAKAAASCTCDAGTSRDRHATGPSTVRLETRLAGGSGSRPCAWSGSATPAC